MSKLQDWVTGCLGLGKHPPLVDRSACERLYFWAYLWPRIRRLIQPLSRMDWHQNHGSDPGDPFDLECTIALLALGSEPDLRIKLRAIENFQYQIQSLSKELEKEIEEIKAESAQLRRRVISRNHH